MTDPTNLTPSDMPSPQSLRTRQDCLTEQQRQFARLLGRLLSDRWQEEQREMQAAGAREATNGETDGPLAL